MVVVFEKLPCVKRWANRNKVLEIEQDSGFERVMVDGEQVGLVPNNPEDRNYTVLHPLSKGYPQVYLDMVVKNSNGRLTRTLRGPMPEPEIEESDDE